MKQLKEIIQEKLTITKDSKISSHKNWDDIYDVCPHLWNAVYNFCEDNYLNKNVNLDEIFDFMLDVYLLKHREFNNKYHNSKFISDINIIEFEKNYFDDSDVIAKEIKKYKENHK